MAHGEPRASDSMRRYIIEQLGWDACVPQYRDEFLL
ncbi:MBL fold metallo-hydrolase RNA specificity domain-containing protein [Oleiphilus messinensis]